MVHNMDGVNAGWPMPGHGTTPSPRRATRSSSGISVTSMQILMDSQWTLPALCAIIGGRQDSHLRHVGHQPKRHLPVSAALGSNCVSSISHSSPRSLTHNGSWSTEASAVVSASVGCRLGGISPAPDHSSAPATTQGENEWILLGEPAGVTP